MDPVTAFGLAASILSVIDVSTKALSLCRELYKDGSLAAHRDTEAITCDLGKQHLPRSTLESFTHVYHLASQDSRSA